MMEQTFRSVLNMSLTGGFVILAVLALRLALKRAPRWISYVLWSVALFRLVCPFSFESAVSLLPSAEPVPVEFLYETPAIRSGIPLLNTTVNPVLQQSLAPTPDASVNPAQVLMFILAVVWLAGAAVMLAYGLISTLRFARRIRFATLLQSDVYESEQIETAFVWGILRPKIYVPAGLSAEQLQHVLAHERVHIRRFDHVTRPLCYVALALHWFNPLAWVAFVLSGRDMELSCDESVLLQSGGDRAAYAGTLLSVSERRSRVVPVAPLAFGESDTKTRIKNVLNYKKPAFWIVAAALVAAVAAAVCLIANPKQPEDKPVQPLNAVFGKIYEFDECLYMTPISSYYPFGGTGIYYNLTADGRLTNISEDTGDILSSHVSNSAYSTVNDAEWRAMFNMTEPVDISRYTTKFRYDISGEYRLYLMDDEVWLARVDERGTLWSLYKIRPVENASVGIIGGADGLTKIYVSDAAGDLSAVQAARAAEYLTEFSAIPRGENGFANEYNGDWDNDGKPDRAYVDKQAADIEGYTLKNRVVVEFGSGESISAEATMLAEMSEWGGDFLLEAADLTGDGQNEILLLINFGGQGGRGSYSLYPYMHTERGWEAMMPPKTGAELALEWKDNTVTVRSGDYYDVVADDKMLREQYLAQDLELEWNRVDGTSYRTEQAADALCDIALVESNGKTLVKTSQYVTGVTGVHSDQLGYLVTVYEWEADGSFCVADMRVVYMPNGY